MPIGNTGLTFGELLRKIMRENPKLSQDSAERIVGRMEHPKKNGKRRRKVKP